MPLELQLRLRDPVTGNLVDMQASDANEVIVVDNKSLAILTAIRDSVATQTTTEASRVLLASLNAKDYATQATLQAALNKLNDIFGAVDGLEITAGNIDISNTNIGLQTDQLESLLAQIRDQLATQATLEAIRVLIANEDFASQTTLAACLVQLQELANPSRGLAKDITIDKAGKGTLRQRQRFDIGTSFIYVGYALNGSLDTAAVWTIKRITLAGGSPTTTEWTAEGTAVWNNRSLESYN